MVSILSKGILSALNGLDWIAVLFKGAGSAWYFSGRWRASLERESSPTEIAVAQIEEVRQIFLQIQDWWNRKTEMEYVSINVKKNLQKLRKQVASNPKKKKAWLNGSLSR